MVCVALQELTVTCNAAVIISKKLSGYLVTKMNPLDRFKKNQAKQYMRAHTPTLHTHTTDGGYSTWLGDHQGRPSNSLYKLHI